MTADRSPLFVRLTSEQAGRLDRAAAAVPAHKKDLIGGLVDRYVDPESPEGIARLREIAGGGRRVTVEVGGDSPVVGHAEFRPAPAPEVLDVAQAAELLAVDETAITELAEQGELPGRRIGGAWRFSRRALLDWLAGT
ncbi:MAG TPA: helix-turn-helix domain-containing protein [Solirubrobacter sp.]|nr:helix-turn-helix domain-containing protein [Solirubrobacter sp.]